MKPFFKLLCAGALLGGSLMADSSVQSIVQALKAKAGQKLPNTVLFARYGDGAFDWLVLTPDGHFAAKLDGMNPDGTFKYTILGDPAQYGLKFDVSLQGVRVETIGQSSAPVGQLTNTEVKIKTANTAITTVITGIAPSLGTQMLGGLQMRDLHEATPLEALLWPVTHHRQTHLKEVYQEACPAGGTLSASGSYTQATVSFNQCRIDSGTTINGSVSLQQSGNGYNGTYHNFTIDSSAYHLSLPSANLTLQLDGSMQLKSYTLSFASSTIQDKQRDITYYFKNFHQQAQIQNSYLTLRTDTLFKASCQNEWTTITTLSPIKGSLSGSCPTAGTIRAKNSQADVKIQINSDSSIDVIDNQNGQQLEHYTNCHSVPQNDICQE